MTKYKICLCDWPWRCRSVIRFVFSIYEDRLSCHGCHETRFVNCESKVLKVLLAALSVVIFLVILRFFTSGDPRPLDTNGGYMTQADGMAESFERFPFFHYLFWAVPAFFTTCILSIPIIQFSLFLCWRKNWDGDDN